MTDAGGARPASDVDALIERLRKEADDVEGYTGEALREAAAALVQLREENARLRKSLFANDQWNGSRVPVGWRCPDCGGVNAPEVRGCPCHGNKTLRERVSTP